MDSTVTLRIPKKMRDELEGLCEDKGVQLSDVVRESLRRIIALHRFDVVRAKALSITDRKRIYSDEEILRIRS